VAIGAQAGREWKSPAFAKNAQSLP
jgi:hypothetical protein